MTNSVSSSDSQKKSIAAFFSGVGGIELGFEQTGEFRVVYANEFDKNACITYRANHPDVPLDSRDIHDVDPDELPDVDVIMGGFPCQAFSIAGYRKGFEDERGDLFFELLKMIRNKQPEVIFIENVKNMVTHDHGNTFKVIREALVMNGYYIKWKVMNGKDYGNVPQNRERIYVVGFKNKNSFNNFIFPEKIELTNNLANVINFADTVDERYYYENERQPFFEKLADKVISQDTVYQWRRQYVRENKSGVIPTLTANMGTGGHNVPIILTNDNRIRKLTPREVFNAQGYPDNFILPDNVAHGQLYKQAGNSVVVPVIRRIAENINSALQNCDSEFSILEKNEYALIKTYMNGPFEGFSYVEKYLPSIDETQFFFELEHDLISDDEYFKLISKNKEKEFYMIEKYYN